jgi:hypothetical protein
MRRSDARAGEHRGGRLRHHRHVDRDAVVALDAEALEHVREPLRHVEQLGVGDRPPLAVFALPVERDPLAEAGVDVPVEAVVRNVQLPAHEPLRPRRLPVEHLLPGLRPVELARPALPPAFGVALRVVVDRGVGGVCLRRELRGRLEDVLVGEQHLELGGLSVCHLSSSGGVAASVVNAVTAQRGSIVGPRELPAGTVHC